MRSILNVSQPQMGKTSHTLSETELHPEFINLNLVFEYNITVEDVLEKAKAYNFTCEKIDKTDIARWRNDLVENRDPADIPNMLVGIMDVHRGSWLEGFLVWAKYRNKPVRAIIDEYDVFGIGHETDRTGYANRDNWLKMIMDEKLVDIIEFNSATNINGVISDNVWEEVNRIKPYQGYCGWDTVDIQTLDDSHFHALLNGELTSEMQRKLRRAYDGRENLLMNLSDRTEAHDTIARTAGLFSDYTNIKRINYASSDTLDSVPDEDTLIVGGQKFGRSVTIPNLSTMVYYRKSIPACANLLQACGRVLGNRRYDPTIITTPTLARSIRQSAELEQKIIDSEILYDVPEARMQWLEEQVKSYDAIKLFTGKSNGLLESTVPKWQVTDDVTGLHKFDHWYEIEMPMDIWDAWEDKTQSDKTGRAMWELCVAAHPHLETFWLEGVRDEGEGTNAANRRRLAIRDYNDGGYRQWVDNKNSKRKYPIMYGAQRFRPGKGFLIVRDPDMQTHSSMCWHHNEYGQKVKLIQKTITRKPS